MKRSLAITLILLILFGSLPMDIYAGNYNDNHYAKAPNEYNEEELYRNIFLTLIYPHVSKAIADYYDAYFSYLPGEDPWSFGFLKIEKKQGVNYTFTIILEVTPYVGPHLSVGRDRITMQIGLEGVAIDKFEHIESYSLPPHYQNIIKTKWPLS